MLTLGQLTAPRDKQPREHACSQLYEKVPAGPGLFTAAAVYCPPLAWLASLLLAHRVRRPHCVQLVGGRWRAALTMVDSNWVQLLIVSSLSDYQGSTAGRAGGSDCLLFSAAVQPAVRVLLAAVKGGLALCAGSAPAMQQKPLAAAPRHASRRASAAAPAAPEINHAPASPLTRSHWLWRPLAPLHWSLKIVAAASSAAPGARVAPSSCRNG